MTRLHLVWTIMNGNRNTLDEMYIMDSDSLLSSCIQWTFWYTDSGVDARLYISSFHTKTACADWVCSMRTRKHSCFQSLSCLCCMWTASKAPYGASPCGWQDLNMSFTHLKDASYETTVPAWMRTFEESWYAITDYFHLLSSFEACILTNLSSFILIQGRILRIQRRTSTSKVLRTKIGCLILLDSWMQGGTGERDVLKKML